MTKLAICFLFCLQEEISFFRKWFLYLIVFVSQSIQGSQTFVLHTAPIIWEHLKKTLRLIFNHKFRIDSILHIPYRKHPFRNKSN